MGNVRQFEEREVGLRAGTRGRTGIYGAGMVQDELFMHPTKPWCGFEIAYPMRTDKLV